MTLRLTLPRARARLALGLTLAGAPNCQSPTGPVTAPNGEAASYGPLASSLRQSPALSRIVDSAPSLRFQILVGVPVGNTLQRKGFRVDAEYFYPASAVKLCAAAAALEKVADLRRDLGASHLSERTPLRIYGTGRVEEQDPTDVETGRISIGQEIRKALLVSSNEAYNRLFDFVGHDELNDRLARAGFDSVRFRHRLGDGNASARRTPRMELLLGSSASIDIPARTGAHVFSPLRVDGLRVGTAYYDADGKRVNAPMSFADRNRASLRDLQDVLVSIVRPDLPNERHLRLDEADRSMLVDILGTLPSESKNPVYSVGTQIDELHKPLFIAVQRALPTHRIRAFGKGGRAYGFVVHNSYVVDETSKRSIFVAATIYTNENGTMNDDQYEYDEVAKPFVDALGVWLSAEYLR